ISGSYDAVIGDDLPVVAWVYADILPDWATVLKNWGDLAGQFHFGVGLHDADRLQGISASSSLTDTDPLPLNQWLHVSWVLDSTAGENSLYINGVLAAGPELYGGTLGLAGGDTSLGLGIKPNSAGTEASLSGPGPWDGMIDEVGIF